MYMYVCRYVDVTVYLFCLLHVHVRVCRDVECYCLFILLTTCTCTCEKSRHMFKWYDHVVKCFPSCIRVQDLLKDHKKAQLETSEIEV